MNIIIDECVPSIVKRVLADRAIVSVQDMGWAGVKNGKLLSLISKEFDVFITSDKNLRYQQNLSDISLAIILLPSNQVPVIKQLLPQIDTALSDIAISDFVEL